MLYVVPTSATIVERENAEIVLVDSPVPQDADCTSTTNGVPLFLGPNKATGRHWSGRSQGGCPILLVGRSGRFFALMRTAWSYSMRGGGVVCNRTGV